MNNWSKKNEIIIFFLGFLLSGIILTLCFIHLKIWPFGDQTLLVVDSVHQYPVSYTHLTLPTIRLV